MSEQPVLLEKSDGIARITLNRPDDGNTMNQALMEGLRSAARECHDDRAVRAVIVTGNGRMFCAGGDIHFMHGMGDAVAGALDTLVDTLHEAIELLQGMSAPVITAINGTAAGAGLSLAAAGDVAISAESAKFCVAYSRVGLSPDGGSTYFLPRLIGMRHARELMLTNRVLDAGQALAYGIVNQVVADEALREQSDTLAAALVQGPRGSHGHIKALLRDTFAHTLNQQLALEKAAMVAQAGSAEAREGLQAFVDKREANFRDL